MTVEHLELTVAADGTWRWTISAADGRELDHGGPYPDRASAIVDLQGRHGDRAPRLRAVDDAKPADGPLSVDYRVEFP
jgi:hypothetical protein